MANTAPEEPIDISRRPFLSGLSHRANPTPGGAHLHAAATGAPAGAPIQLPVTPIPEGESPSPQVQVGAADQSLLFTSPTPIIQAHTDTRPQPEPLDPNLAGLDWGLVRVHVQQLDLGGIKVRDRANFDVATASAFPETPEEERARKQIEDTVDEHINRVVLTQGEDYDWTTAKKAAHVQAVFDEAFRYGRISPLLREDLESFNVYGSRKVVVIKPGGIKEVRPPISRDNDELDRLVQKIATDRGRTYAIPHGRVRLDIGGGRFTALGGPVQVPETTVAVRRHTHVDVCLDDFVRDGMLTSNMAELLGASVRAHQSLLISGWANAGKTTFLRGVLAELDPDETLITMETERELYLDKLPDRHTEVVPMQYMPAATGGEDSEAAFSLDEALEYSKRYNAQTFVFGEILGAKEAATAVAAFQGGKGTSSTIHAKNAQGAISALSRFLTRAGGFSDNLVPQQEIIDTITFIVSLGSMRWSDGTERRTVTEIAQVISADAGPGRVRAISKPIYKWDRARQQHVADERPLPAVQDELLEAGLRDDFFEEWQA